MFHEVLIHKNFKVLKGWMFYVFLNKDQFFCKMGEKKKKQTSKQTNKQTNEWNDHELK
jgi:hypothetical protein